MDETQSEANTREGAGEPTIRARLSLDDHPPVEFAPIRFPSQLEVLFENVSAADLKTLRAEASLDLKTGQYDVPVTEAESLSVTVPPDCRCLGSVVAAHPFGDSKAVVQRAEISFDPPLVLENVFPTLAELPTLFEDHTVGLVRSFLDDTNAAKMAAAAFETIRDFLLSSGFLRQDEGLPGEEWLRGGFGRLRTTVREGVDRLTKIHLTRAVARPKKRRGRWQLKIRFSGHVEVAGRLPVPFQKVLLPYAILPAPYADLDSLLSEQPLATARLFFERFNSEGMAVETLRAIDSFRGRFFARGYLPDTAVELETADHGAVEVVFASPGIGEIKVHFAGSIDRDRVGLEIDLLEATSRKSHLTAEGSIECFRHSDDDSRTDEPITDILVDALSTRCWPADRLRADAFGRLGPDCHLSEFELGLHYLNHLLKGGVDLYLAFQELSPELQFSASTDPTRSGAPRQEAKLSVVGLASIQQGTTVNDGFTTLEPQAQGKLTGQVVWKGGKTIEAVLEGSAELELTGRTEMEPFPELSIGDEDLVSTVQGEVEFVGRIATREDGPNLIVGDFADSYAKIRLARAEAALDPQRLSIPRGSTIDIRLAEAVLGTDGLGRMVTEVKWDFQGRSPTVVSGQDSVEILVPDLRQGDLTLHISPGGGLSITGNEGGLYDFHFFNALINPGAELDRWLEILDDDEAVQHVLDAARLFSSEIADLLVKLRQFERRARDILEDEGVTEPRHGIPGPKIARILSRLISDSNDLEDRIYPLVKQITDGVGLDVPAVKRLLHDNLPEHELDFEIDRGVRWLGVLLSPTKPLPAFRVRTVLPLAEDPTFTQLLDDLPSAREIYEWVDGDDPLTAKASASIARVASYLTLEQLDYIRSRHREDLRPSDISRLRYVRGLKQRVRLISEGYGGLSFTPQSLATAFFLADAITISHGERRRAGDDPVTFRPHEVLADCLLGPQDIALLLHANLTQVFQGRTVQLHRRMLLDYILEKPPAFLREVLIEMGSGNDRLLAGALNTLLDAEQDQMNEPINMVDVFEDRLDIGCPRRSDYMAGGRWAKLSYWEELNRSAQEVLSEAEPYLALKQHLQVRRRGLPAPVASSKSLKTLVAGAQKAIEKGDKLGQKWWTAESPTEKQQKAAVAAYQEAFEKCAAVREKDPCAFHQPWFKTFWARNHEALVVLSVVRNHQEDIDAVRRWLSVRTGREDEIGDEQELVETVIEALYAYESDRETLKSDPLVRLLIDPPEEHLDFTVVSAMGVITEGARGTELQDAFRRLEERRGIKLERADVATMRSLEYNAEKIEEAVRKVTTPWGTIGYSQGCTNILCAESRLLGGTPDQQALMTGFRCRTLLFSAVNGSAHGTCGDWKFLRAMIDVDRFMKHYQAIFSNRAIQVAIKSINLGMESREFVLGMAGANSLSHAGTLPLARDGQFDSAAPTSTVRGIVETETLPEALEMLANVLTRQIEHPNHDTQVDIDEAVGHFVWVKNPQSGVLEQCDMGSMPQRTHHWSPLIYATELVTTDRDQELCIYDFPKDRHVFPWIDVNARFGVIKSTRGLK